MVRPTATNSRESSKKGRRDRCNNIVTIKTLAVTSVAPRSLCTTAVFQIFEPQAYLLYELTVNVIQRDRYAILPF